MPVPGPVAPVDGEIQLDIVAFLPALEFIFKQQLSGGASSIKDDHPPELGALIQYLVDQRTRGGEPQSTRREQHVLAAEVLDRKAVAIWPANADPVTRHQAMQRTGHVSGFA